MTYKVKRKKRLPEHYFREKELRLAREKYKGKLPVGVVLKEGVRVSQRVPKRTHQKGKFVLFRGKTYLITKVSRKGVHLSEVKRKNGLLDKSKYGKPKFIPEKKYSGKAVAYYIPFVFAPA